MAGHPEPYDESIRTMASVGIQGEDAKTGVLQAVYKAVFENSEEFRRIAEERAAKRRAEEAARAEAARKQAAETSSTQSPGVIVDVKSADVSAEASAPAPAPVASPTKTVDLVA